MSPASKNSFGTRETLHVDGKPYEIFRLSALEKKGVGHAAKLPFSLQVLLENLLRQEDGRFVRPGDIEALAGWNPNAATQKEISFMPARVLLQDFTGVPAVVDFAAMREAIRTLGGDPKKVNPLLPAELVIDHSVQVDKFGSDMAFAFNAELEFQRNVERYAFLRWGQEALNNFKVVPPDTGICHQVNLEYLARVVFDAAVDGKTLAFPDSLVGTDSHTTMVNSLAVSGWGLPDRATIANMAPEYGATMGFFPVDAETLSYLRFTGRTETRVRLVEEYSKAQGIFRTDATPDPIYTDKLELDLATVEATLAGPKRPQDRVPLRQSKSSFEKSLEGAAQKHVAVRNNGDKFELSNGSVVIAAITSCTNTSNPSLMLGAGLLAKKAIERGLHSKPWVKTSLAPGSKVVTDYLKAAGLGKYLDELGFQLVGYGCTTCICNSGPLEEHIGAGIKENSLVAVSVLSGNRNFEGRIHPLVRANYLASPPLVVAYALAGRMDFDMASEPLGNDKSGKPVFLRDIWPTPKEVEDTVRSAVTTGMYQKEYSEVFQGDSRWQGLKVPKGDIYAWDKKSTYIKNPPFFEKISKSPAPLTDIRSARALAMLGNSITTDHISPAGSIGVDSPAGKSLIEQGVKPVDFNSYGARRGNHEVMMRGTFAHIRLRHQLAPGTEGGWTLHQPSGEKMTIYDAAMRYKQEGVPLMVLAGKEYGAGSSRDWAAKGTLLLGVRAVIAESYERIHRSNLVGMGVLPLEFKAGETAEALGLSGHESFTVAGMSKLAPRAKLRVQARDDQGGTKTFEAVARADTPEEVAYYRHGGILPYVLRQML